jgi:MFS transporter, PAT family, beta-lactamase induction signal transducer AmpG
MPPHPPPWIFGITGLPGGIFQGFLSIALPFLLRKAGVPVEGIAAIIATASLPTIYYFLWSPVVDVGMKARNWLMLSAITSAACAYFAFLLPIPGQLSLFTALLFLASSLNMIVSSSNGSLMASTMPINLRGRASGWYQCGNVGGAALGGGALLWVAESFSTVSTALVLVLMITLPSLAGLVIQEPVRESISVLQTWRITFREVWDTLKSRSGLTGLVFFIAPLGAGALLNLFSAVAVDFHASAEIVTWITGFGGGLLICAGSVAGGFLCDRIGRRTTYTFCGILFVLCCAAMALAPLTPQTYIIGSSAYLFLLGMAYAAFTAIVLEVVGSGGRSGATRYSLFCASGNIPIVFMTWFDGKGYGAFGTRGLLGFEAVGNLIGTVIVIAMIRYVLLSKIEYTGLAER